MKMPDHADASSAPRNVSRNPRDCVLPFAVSIPQETSFRKSSAVRLLSAKGNPVSR